MIKKLPGYSKIIILGSNGSIGKSLKSFFFKKKISCIPLDLPIYDITNSKFKLNKKKFSKNITYTIINCAGLMGADISRKKIENFFSVNGFSVENIFEHFKDLNVDKIIHLSSETIFGSGINLKENSNKKPNHPYAISKLIAEMSLKKISKKKNNKIKILVLRLPIVLFKKQKFHNTLSIICKEAKLGKKINIFGDGKHYRKYIHENDLCEIINKILKYKQSKKIDFYNLQGFIVNTLEIVNEIKGIKRN